jgi:protein-disulfide isomerase
MMRTVRFWRSVLLAGLVFLGTGPLSAIVLTTIPSDGNVFGPPSSLVGWGYSLTNNDPSNWFVSTDLNSDSFSNGAPSLLFDFPILAPGDTVTEAFDPVNSIGLFELQWNPSAPVGFANSGNFVLSGQWWDGDPFNGGNLIATAPDVLSAYSATVGTVSSVPEPSSLSLWICGLLLGFICAAARRLTRRRIAPTALLIVVAIVAGVGQDAAAQEHEKDSGITRQQANEILNELKAIRQLLQQQNKPSASPPAAPQTGKLRLEGKFSLGAIDAPLTIVEFTDYECPYCRQFESTTFAELRRKYIDTGQVRFIERDLPLVDAHPNAMRAAEAAHCAGDQNKFWAMHDALFKNPEQLGGKGLVDQAEALRLDVAAFQLCLESGKHRPEIQRDMQSAASLQIQGTPSFVIGKSTGDDLDGAIVVGAQALSVFEAALKAAGRID